MRRFIFAVIMFVVAIGIVACGRTNQIPNDDNNIVMVSGDMEKIK